MPDKKQNSAQAKRIGLLCPECGLCCDGTLFADVKLQPGEDSEFLRRQGLVVRKRGPRCRFAQPCHCFQNRRCAIYADRPVQCRDFECSTLKQAIRGEVTPSVALRRIRNAQRLAERVRNLLQETGHMDDSLALTQRYRAVMRQPIQLSSTDDEAALRGELMLAMHELMECVHNDFLNRETTP